MISQTEPLQGASDLDRCAQEPIHIIGHIQPHGMLFALSEPDLIVRQVSANVSVLLGKTPEELLNRTFEVVLGPEQFALFRSLTLSQEAPQENPLPMRLAEGALAVLCVAHRRDGVLVVEVELQEGAYSFEPLSLNAHIRLPLARLELASGIAELSALAVREIRRLSGFDRVMIYRFDEEWSGEVIAESAVPSPISYLGLRFPAADIPAQARRLFVQNPVRAIADVDACPVAIVPEIGAQTGRPLDLTFSFLRAPASIHLEYLRNIGVQSSLTVSILVRQQLWGLIACHHSSPRHVDYSTRSLCELVGQVLGSQMTLRMDNAALELRLAFRILLDNYVAQMDASGSVVFADCFLNQPLLELFGADGLVVSLGGVISSYGSGLEPAVLLPVIGRLREFSSNGIASANMLSALVPGSISEVSEVSGALYVGLGGESGDCLVLLRRELVTTVTWAGNPDKRVNTDAEGRLHPRASFQAWQETVRGRSRPWSELEVEGAEALRVQLLQRRASFESAWSKRRFRFLADSIPQLILTANPDGSVDYCNQRWVTYTGDSLEQLIDRGWEYLVHPDDLADCLEHWKRAIATERDYEWEYRLRRSTDGAYRWHHAHAFPLRNHKGEVAHWISAATDVEDQKQADRELMRSRDRLQNVLDGSTNVSIIAMDTQGLITLFNSGAEHLLGYTLEESVGRQMQGMIHLESEVVARGLELTQESGKPVQGFDVIVEKAKNGGHEEREWTYIRKDGSPLRVHLVVTALRGLDGTINGFLSVAMDVSARRDVEDRLHASEERLRLMIDAVDDYALLMLDADGRVATWNTGAERMKGYKASEIIGKHFSCFYSPEEIEQGHPDQELAVAAREGRYAEEGWRVRKDGSRFLAHVLIAAVHDGTSKLRGFAKVVRDVTEIRNAEVLQRKNEQYFQLLVDAVDDYALLMLDAHGRVATWNAGAERMTGYQASEIIGRHFSCFYTPEAIGQGLPGHELAIAAREGRYREEGWRVRKDGSRFWGDVIIGAVYGGDGELLGFAKVTRDVTKSREAEQKLRTLAARGLAIQALDAGLWDWDLRTNVAVWDERMLEIYGLPGSTEASYQLWASRVVPADLQSSEASLQRSIATKSQGSMEFRIRLPNGSVRYIQAGHGTVLDDAGEVVRVIGINIDSTDRKFNEDLEQQVADRTVRLKAANEELEKFAYVASHDLKAPLRAINKSAKWLEEDLAEHLTDETRDHLNVMNGRIKRMDKLLDDLLEYARIGRAPDGRYSEVMRGDLLMEGVLDLLSLEGFTVEVSPSFANIQVPRMPLQQILMNLISNGIKHHHKRPGKIWVTVENEKDFYAFAVKDDGPGIGAMFHDQIFEMFRTLRPRDQVEGSGMGLAMVRKHIEVGGGTLRLESAPGQGSIFRFTWPKQEQLRKELE